MKPSTGDISDLSRHLDGAEAKHNPMPYASIQMRVT